MVDDEGNTLIITKKSLTIRIKGDLLLQVLQVLIVSGWNRNTNIIKVTSISWLE